MQTLAWISLALALLPFVLTLRNLRDLAPPPTDRAAHAAPVSILIPARNEEKGIEKAVMAALAQTHPMIEVIVLDDHSEDRTAALVERIAARDERLRLERAPALPDGWNGKQHACWRLALLARHDVLMFVDADVELAPDAARRAALALRAGPAELVSGFPLQLARSPLEHLIIPMIHMLLLGYLPIAMMRRSPAPGFGAGCGQLMVAERGIYLAVEGHKAIRTSRHDGVTLPRRFRTFGHLTDLFDATDLAACRMYEGAAALWSGFLKNADEGMAKPVALPIWTILLFGGHVLPWLLVALALVGVAGFGVFAVSAAAVAANTAQRLLLARRFRQPYWLAALHPLAVSAVLVLQWQALIRKVRGRPAQWRGRTYPAADTGS